MTPAARRTLRVWLPGLALAASLYVYAGTLTATINGLGLGAALLVAGFTALAARDGSRAWEVTGRG